MKKHGKYKTRLYSILTNVKSRCYNTNYPYYSYYGARGIKVCDEWLNDFMNFYNWAINNGYQEDLTLDRIDANGNYEPSNCRWITMKEQSRNKNCNINFTINGVTKCLKDWCKQYNIKYTSAYARINRLNWTIEQALELQERNK